ncbi:MAG: AtpZ/AtpI family protein [Bacteroidota bacterium]
MGGAQKYMGLGIQAGVSVGFYLGMGLLLDKWLGTLPWLTLVGAFVGVIGMFFLFLRMNRELDESSRQTEVENEAEGRVEQVD